MDDGRMTWLDPERGSWQLKKILVVGSIATGSIAQIIHVCPGKFQVKYGIPLFVRGWIAPKIQMPLNQASVLLHRIYTPPPLSACWWKIHRHYTQGGMMRSVETEKNMRKWKGKWGKLRGKMRSFFKAKKNSEKNRAGGKKKTKK